MNDLNKFREDTKKWLDENCPPSMRSGADSNIPIDEVWGGRKAEYKNPESKIWLDKMGEKGWTMPTVSTVSSVSILSPRRDTVYTIRTVDIVRTVRFLDIHMGTPVLLWTLLRGLGMFRTTFGVANVPNVPNIFREHYSG